MKKLRIVFFIIALSIIIQFGFFPFFYDNINLFLVVLILMIFAALIVYLNIEWLKKKLLVVLFNIVADESNDIEKIAINIIDGVKSNDKKVLSQGITDATRKVEKYYVGKEMNRFAITALSSLFILLGGVLGYVFIDQQNKLIITQNDLVKSQNILTSKQNKLIEQQSKRIDQQVYLLDAQNQSSLVFLFSNIMDQMNDELTLDYLNDGVRNLSPQLIARIISLTQRLRPYRYFENDSLSSGMYSPEKGQLFVNMIKSDLDLKTKNKILKESNFEYSDVRGIYLGESDYYYVNMKNCKFTNVIFDNVSFYYSDFTGSKFINCEFKKVVIFDSFLNSTTIGVTKTPVLDWNNLKYDENGSPIDTVTRHDIKFEKSRIVNSLFDGNFGELDFRSSIIKDCYFKGSCNWAYYRNSIVSDIGAKYDDTNSDKTPFSIIAVPTVQDWLKTPFYYANSDVLGLAIMRLMEFDRYEKDSIIYFGDFNLTEFTEKEKIYIIKSKIPKGRNTNELDLTTIREEFLAVPIYKDE